MFRFKQMVLLLLLILNFSYSSDFNFRSFPNNKQFFPRDSNDQYTLRVLGWYNGNINANDKILIKFYENEDEILLKSIPLSEVFTFTLSIPAKLKTYKLELFKNDSLVKSAKDITCGDLLLVTGQSNAYGGYASPSIFIKSFGYKDSSLIDSVNMDLCKNDTLWKSDLSDGYCRIGASWQALVEDLQQTEKIPFCIINGALGGKSISFFLPDTIDRTNLMTNYGRLLFRLKKSGLLNAVKVIIWHQGESDTYSHLATKYTKRFRKLYNAWFEDFPNLKKIYLYQIGIGCGSTTYASQFREIQRKIPQQFDHIQSMSTVGYLSHKEIDKCHYDNYSYQLLGKRLVNAYKYDIFGSGTNKGVYPPNIQNVFYTSSEKKQIVLEFDQTLTWPSERYPDKIENYFYFGNDSFLVDSGFVHENGFTLILNLKKQPSLDSISYLPQKFYNRTKVVYEGPWLTSKNGLGAFSFYNYCINDTGVIKDVTSINLIAKNVMEKNSIFIYPNPTNISANIRITISKAGLYSLDIIDVLGKVKSIFSNNYLEPGLYDIFKSFRDFSSGNYFLVLSSKNNKKIFRKLLLLK